MMTSELSTGKTIFILAVVVGCFAILWPKVFYPMLTASVKSSATQQAPPQWRDPMNAHQLTQLCFLLEEQRDPSAVGFERWSEADCFEQIKRSCKIVLTERLLENFRLYKDKSNLTECLRQRYDLTPLKVSAAAPPPTRTRPYQPYTAVHPHVRPERPSHLHPEVMHPALREKGRTMPQRTIEKEARPGPMPGLRPPMGGGGHMVPPQTKGSGAMGVIMPLYTVGIVIFFIYTIMKVLFKKNCEEDKTPKLKDFHMDPEYRKYVFAEEYLDSANASHRDLLRRQERESSRQRRRQEVTPPDTKIGKPECEQKDEQMDQLRRRLEETERAMERLMSQMGSVTDKLTAAKITEVLSQAQAQAKMLKMGLDDVMSASINEDGAASLPPPAPNSTTTTTHTTMTPTTPKELGEGASDDDFTTSEAFTNTFSEDYSLPIALQRHLLDLQVKDQYMKGTSAGTFVPPPPTPPQEVASLSEDEASVEVVQAAETTPFPPTTNDIPYVTPIKDNFKPIECPEVKIIEKLVIEAPTMVIEKETEKINEINEEKKPEKMAAVVGKIENKTIEEKETENVHEENNKKQELASEKSKIEQKLEEKKINKEADEISSKKPCIPPILNKDLNRILLEAKLKADFSLPSDIALHDDNESFGDRSSNASETGADISELKSFADECICTSANSDNPPVVQEQIIPEVNYQVPELNMPKSDAPIETLPLENKFLEENKSNNKEHVEHVPEVTLEQAIARIAASLPKGVEHGTQTEENKKLSVLNFESTYQINKQEQEKGMSIYEVEDKINEIILDANLPMETQLLVREAHVGSRPLENIEIDASEIDNNPCVVTSQVSLAFVGLEQNEHEPEGVMTIFIPEKRIHTPAVNNPSNDINLETSNISKAKGHVNKFIPLSETNSTEEIKNSIVPTFVAENNILLPDIQSSVLQKADQFVYQEGNQFEKQKVENISETNKFEDKNIVAESREQANVDQSELQKVIDEENVAINTDKMNVISKQIQLSEDSVDLTPNENIPPTEELNIFAAEPESCHLLNMKEQQEQQRIEYEKSILNDLVETDRSKAFIELVDNRHTVMEDDLKSDKKQKSELFDSISKLSPQPMIEDKDTQVNEDSTNLKLSEVTYDKMLSPESLITAKSDYLKPLNDTLQLIEQCSATPPTQLIEKNLETMQKEFESLITFDARPTEVFTQNKDDSNFEIVKPQELIIDNEIESNLQQQPPHDSLSNSNILSKQHSINEECPNQNEIDREKTHLESALSIDSLDLDNELISGRENASLPDATIGEMFRPSSPIPPSPTISDLIEIKEMTSETIEPCPLTVEDTIEMDMPVIKVEIINNFKFCPELSRIAEVLVQRTTNEALERISKLNLYEIEQIKKEATESYSAENNSQRTTTESPETILKHENVYNLEKNLQPGNRGDDDELLLTSNSESVSDSQLHSRKDSQTSSYERRFAVVSAEHANGLPKVEPSNETMERVEVKPLVINNQDLPSSLEPHRSKSAEEAALIASKGVKLNSVQAQGSSNPSQATDDEEPIETIEVDSSSAIVASSFLNEKLSTNSSKTNMKILRRVNMKENDGHKEEPSMIEGRNLNEGSCVEELLSEKKKQTQPSTDD